jgi:hypothetical protein
MPLHAQKQLFQFDPYFTIPVVKAGEHPEQKLNSLIFLRAVASKNSVYTGEAFLAEYKLYRAVNSDPSPGKQPTFTGCGVLELSPLNGPGTEIVDGKLYHVVLLRKVQLTPLRDGPLLLDPASVNNNVQFVTADSPRYVKTIIFEATSKPLSVEVKPLPDKGKPEGFSGLVGNFGISIKADSNTVPAGENTHLKLVIKGTGNIAAVAAPDIQWPANTEHFEPETNQHLAREEFPSGGEKVFDIPFIGSKEGTVTIPPIYFTFFNPQTQHYDSAHTDSLTIHFTKAKPKQTLHEMITEDFTNRTYLWIVPALALAIAFVLIITGKSQRKEKNKQRKEATDQKKPLPLILPPAERPDFVKGLNALSSIEDHLVFFNRAKELLTQALREKLNSFAFYEADILQELQLKSHNKVLAETVEQIYKICNQNLYSPIVNNEQRITLQAALAEVIKQLEV